MRVGRKVLAAPCGLGGMGGHVPQFPGVIVEYGRKLKKPRHEIRIPKPALRTAEHHHILAAKMREAKANTRAENIKRARSDNVKEFLLAVQPLNLLNRTKIKIENKINYEKQN